MKALKVFGLLICAVALLGVLSAAAPLRATPPAGGFSQMAYDTKAKLVILYGGISGYWADPSAWNTDTWTYDPVKNLWTKKSPAIHPAGSHGGSMVYDSKADRMILSLPTDDTAAPGTPMATWAYDLKKDTWERRAEGPMMMAGGQLLAYDAESDRTIMFGGMAVPEWQERDVTWAYDYNTNTWTNMQPFKHPEGIDSVGMVYDSKADRVVLWGDYGRKWYNASLEDAVWTYDYNTNTWQKFDHHKTDGPLVRDYNKLAYDEVADKIIMYGGYWFGNDETWVYDLNTDTWEQMLPAANPGPLSVYSMVYVKDINKTILFGGGDLGTYEFKTDTWSYDLGANTWTLVYPGQ